MNQAYSDDPRGAINANFKESPPSKGKLLFITPNYPEVCDGVGDYTYYLAHALVDEGYEVAVLTSKNPDISSDSKVQVLPTITKWNFLELPFILQQIVRFRPDFCLLQYVASGYASRTSAPFYIILLAFMMRLKGIRLVTTFHEVALRLYWHNLRYVLAALAQRFIAFGLGHLSAGNITSIGSYAQWLRKYHIPVQIIPIGSNIPRLEISVEERRQLRQRLTPKGEKLVATFGGAGPSRRKELILKGIKWCQEASGLKVCLLYVGHISEYNKTALEEEARRLGLNNSLYFTGRLPAREAFKYLNISDLYVFLAIGDRPTEGGICGRSGSALAGFAAGLPILSNQGNLTDPIFQHGKNVFLLDQVNEVTLGQAILLLLVENNLREILRGGASKTFEAEFSWEKVARRYSQYLGKVSISEGVHEKYYR